MVRKNPSGSARPVRTPESRHAVAGPVKPSPISSRAWAEAARWPLGCAHAVHGTVQRYSYRLRVLRPASGLPLHPPSKPTLSILLPTPTEQTHVDRPTLTRHAHRPCRCALAASACLPLVCMTLRRRHPFAWPAVFDSSPTSSAHLPLDCPSGVALSLPATMMMPHRPCR